MSQAAVILAVDTTTEFGSVAVRRSGETVAEMHLNSTDGFGQMIIQAIQDVMSQAKTSLAKIDCFAAASGPGSFTGVRVALSVVKGLAEVMHKPAVGISNLRALSLSGHSPLRAVVLDARRSQVYCAVYDSRLALRGEETVSTWDEWTKFFPPGAELIGFEGGPCQTAGVTFTRASPFVAPAIAECAEIDGPASWVNPVSLDANYVRRSDAQMFWKDV